MCIRDRSDGTGIVHIAPAFGEDDANVGRKYDLPFVQFVDGKGELTKETPYAGIFVKKADPEVLKDLEAQGKLFDAPKFEHEYPHCWRCDTPLIYLSLIHILLQWDMQTTVPKLGQAAHVDALTYFSTKSFEMGTSEKLGEFLEKLAQPAEYDALDDTWRFIVKRMKRDYDRNKRIPVSYTHLQQDRRCSRGRRKEGRPAVSRCR